MKKSSTVVLGETEYEVPQLNIGQLERVTDLFAAGGSRIGFGVLRIALERATPKIADVAQVEATTEEIGAAVKIILEMSGLAPRKTETGEASAGSQSPT